VFRPALSASRGKLFSNHPHGRAVHAASFLRRREIVLDEELRAAPQELARIFVHELFHFAWLRLGNPRRESYGSLLHAEMAGGVRGELGWSAELTKSHFLRQEKTGLWRAYICESFCDTAAFLYAGCDSHEEFTLASKWRLRRARWFHESLDRRALSI